MSPDESTEDGIPMLTLAASNGPKEMVELLLQYGAHVQSHGNENIVASALIFKQREIAALLIGQGAYVVKPAWVTQWSSPLVVATGAGDAELVRAILERGADPNDVMTIGQTPAIQMAARVNDIQILEMLITAGADINQTDANGRTPLCCATREGNAEAANYLKAHGGTLLGCMKRE